jgi:hypothetical protein
MNKGSVPFIALYRSQPALAFESGHGKIMPNIHCPSKAFRVGTYRGWPHFRRRFYPHDYAMSLLGLHSRLLEASRAAIYLPGHHIAP